MYHVVQQNYVTKSHLNWSDISVSEGKPSSSAWRMADGMYWRSTWSDQTHLFPSPDSASCYSCHIHLYISSVSCVGCKTEKQLRGKTDLLRRRSWARERHHYITTDARLQVFATQHWDGQLRVTTDTFFQRYSPKQKTLSTEALVNRSAAKQQLRVAFVAGVTAPSRRAHAGVAVSNTSVSGDATVTRVCHQVTPCGRYRHR